jgi:hypothetical protein
LKLQIYDVAFEKRTHLLLDRRRGDPEKLLDVRRGEAVANHALLDGIAVDPHLQHFGVPEEMNESSK